MALCGPLVWGLLRVRCGRKLRWWDAVQSWLSKRNAAPAAVLRIVLYK